MTKSILFAFAFGLFAIASFGASSSANACATCGCADKAAHSHAKKAPCEKCLKAGKPCKCGDHGAKKPCEKKLGEKKPCVKCAESEHAFQKQKTMGTSTVDHSEKGSLTFKSGTSIPTRGSGSYNE